MSLSRDGATPPRIPSPPAAPVDARRLEQAYDACLKITGRHYENFPVASRLLPARLRRPISVIYAFARTADDFADEGERSAVERRALLDGFSRALDAIRHDDSGETDPIFIALRDVVRRHRLSLDCFDDLLTAFRMDVDKKRYATFGEVMHYCRHSANPVGRLLLQLCGRDDPRNVADSDRICSALQLINFLQDIAQDHAENDRVYLPQDDMARFGVSDADIAGRRNSPAMTRLVHHQIRRAAALLHAGMPLGARLAGRLGLEIRLTALAGSRVLDKLAAQTDVFARPRLDWRDWIGITIALLRRRDRAAGA